ncbi:MAG: hypothetical protein WD043_02495 [Gemmatimonadales bacterium]
MNGTFAALLRLRLQSAKKTPEELAASVDLPVAYVEALLDGSGRPPKPSRSDIYDRMTRCLKVDRKELAQAADAERVVATLAAPGAPVAAALLSLCNPTTTATLKERGNRQLLTDTLQRLLALMQASVLRTLGDAVTMRVAASSRGITYPDQRALILQYLDATVDTVTVGQVAEFIQPRLGSWDVDLTTGVLRIVMRSQESRDQHRRHPSSRRVV